MRYILSVMMFLTGLYVTSPEDPQPGEWRVNFDDQCGTKFERWPEVRKGIMLPEAVMHDSFEIAGQGREVVGVWSFFGIDPGDKVELDANLFLDGKPVVLRSPHKPWSSDYEAWQWFPNYNIKIGPVTTIHVDVSANVTGENHTTPRAEGVDTARPHWGFWVVYSCEVDTPDVPSVTPPSSDGPQPDEYITIDRALSISDSIEKGLQEITWQGSRHFSNTVARCGWAFEEGQSLEGHREEFLDIAGRGVDLVSEGAHLTDRLREVNHRCTINPRFCGRSEVKRGIPDEFVTRREGHLQEAAAINSSLLSGDPLLGVAYDNIQGWCDYQNRNR